MTDAMMILVHGASAGVFCAVALALAAGGVSTPQRWTAILLMIGAAAHVVDNIGMELTGRFHPYLSVWLLSCAAVGFFWAFVQASFADRPLTPLQRLAPSLILVAALLIGRATVAATGQTFFMFYSALVAALMAHAAWMLAVGWRGDLVEARRRLRLPLLAITASYILVVQAYDMFHMAGLRLPSVDDVQGLVMLFLAGGATLVLLEPHTPLLTAAPPAPDPAAQREKPAADAIDPADRALAARLERAMDQEEVWRQEDLTIASLAERLKTPEHRLRHLINAQLGHRNFAAFVNARRIAAAKAALADPENGRTPVSAIAFDLGFASLGPFNRAFKEATGLTPTAYRQAALADASPKLKTAD